MKTQHKDNRITLLVVREAGRPVRQVHLSKPLALVLPAAAALSISSLVTSMHFHASRSIAELEAEAASLSLANLRMEMKVADKDQTLLQLRSKVTELSEEAATIKDKLKSVSELEAQLQSLIETEQDGGADPEADRDSASISGDAVSGNRLTAYSAAPAANYKANAAGGAQSGTALSSLPAVSFRLGAVASAIRSTVTPQVGGEYIAVYQEDPLGLVQEARDDYEEIRSLLDELLTSLSATITEAREVQSAEARLQAKEELAEQARLAPAVIWPTQSKIITSSFGYRSDPFKGVSAYHSGIDIAGSIGDPVYAAMDGEVTASDQMGARGKYIIIKHANGLETWYMHLNSMDVSEGDYISKGQQIGTLGNTGRSTGPHLHFQVLKQNKAVNPLGYVEP
ncbi:M23 family metallopeptidase [Paenibacillus camerounensis]|uniref:M23 family metallopeptidase n=1 Tax=Paenibacillus camerounensis TaxID=1243663 RepID=UPI0005AB4732|nr:M23 family metallopeptidase [Paenibacillus camerounensis]